MRLDVLLMLFVMGHLLTFTPSSSPGVTNHTVYYGPHPSRLVTNRVHLGGSTSWTITNVSPATVAFLFCTAWAGDTESDPSHEILFTNASVIRLNMVLEKASSPNGPYLLLTNQLNYIAATEGSMFYRVRMEAITSP